VNVTPARYVASVVVVDAGACGAGAERVAQPDETGAHGERPQPGSEFTGGAFPDSWLLESGFPGGRFPDEG
jgi:hypothetical protein